MTERFPFRFDRLARAALAPAGIWPSNSAVEVDDDELRISYGPWRIVTALSNVVAAEVGGPYLWARAVGPRLSLADGGVTFGTNARAGVCVRFCSPVPGLLPVDWLRHPGVTVTVAQPRKLANRLSSPSAG